MGAEEEPSGPVDTRLRDLRPTDRPVAITARIVAVARREIVRKSDGGRRPVLSGLLSDGTATVRFTWWDPPGEEIDRGLVIRAAPVQVREFRGKAELTFGWKTHVAPASPTELPSLPPEEMLRRTLAALRPPEEGFMVEARVLEVEPKTVTVGADRREIHQGLLGDGSGIVAFTAWTDFRLRPGEALRISGAYTRSFRGRPQLVLDERAHVERIEGQDLPPLSDPSSDRPTPLGRLLEGAGSERVVVAGRALALQPPSGLVLRCPQCRRLLRSGACREHGTVEGIPDLRLRLVLDDGTGTITLNLERPVVERITGRTLEACRDLLAAHPDPSVVETELLGTVFGHRVRARGPVSRDDFGLSMYPVEVEREAPRAGAPAGTTPARPGAS
jgi:replication factor A1